MTHASNPESDAPTPDGAAADQADDAHGGGHGDDSHGHGDDSLGPINIAAWGAGLLGAIVGLVIAACFVVATSPG